MLSLIVALIILHRHGKDDERHTEAQRHLLTKGFAGHTTRNQRA